MLSFYKVTAETPGGDTNEYVFFGDLDQNDEQVRFIKFMIECCKDCANRFIAPRGWKEKDWKNQTRAEWEPMEENGRTYFDSEVFF